MDEIKKAFNVDPCFIFTILELLVCLVSLTTHATDRVIYFNAKSLDLAKFSIHLNHLCSIISGGYLLINIVILITSCMVDRDLYMEAVYMVVGVLLNFSVGCSGLYFTLKYRTTYALMLNRKEWDKNTFQCSIAFAGLAIANGFLMTVSSFFIFRDIFKIQ